MDFTLTSTGRPISSLSIRAESAGEVAVLGLLATACDKNDEVTRQTAEVNGRTIIPAVAADKDGAAPASCPILPASNPWNTDISALPVHRLSDGYVASIGAGDHLHPDLKLNIQDAFSAGDRVTVRFTLDGTHEGLLLSVAGTGKRFSINQINIYRMEGGQVVETWQLPDLAGFLKQVGE